MTDHERILRLLPAAGTLNLPTSSTFLGSAHDRHWLHHSERGPAGLPSRQRSERLGRWFKLTAVCVPSFGPSVTPNTKAAQSYSRLGCRLFVNLGWLALRRLGLFFLFQSLHDPHSGKTRVT